MPAAEIHPSPTQPRAIRGLPEALGLIRTIGYERPARPLNPAELEGAFVIRSHGTVQQGYRVLMGSTSDLPRGLQPLAKAVQNNVHDPSARMRMMGA